MTSADRFFQLSFEMSIHPPKVVHFNSSPNSNQINTSTSTQFIPWSERYPKLLKLFNVLTHSNHFNLSNHILNSSPHLNSIHHQLHHHHQNQLHELNHNLGSLIEYSNQLLNSKDHHPSSIEIKLFKRVIQFKLDPNTDFIKIRQLSSSECGQVELVKSRLSKDELRNQRNVFVLKTIYKSAAIRMRDHISADAELAILQLSRSSETNQTSSIQGILPNLRASFQSSDALYILTSYLPGGTLSDLISQRQENKSNPIQDHEYEKIVKQWVSEIVLGLNWLHTTHLWVHRDLKPSNILLSLDGHIVLNDFGTAAPLLKVQAPLLDQYHFEKYHEENWYDFPRLLVPKSYSRTLVGTCDYIAPEILHSHLHTVMDLIDSDSESTTSTDELNDHEVGGLYGNEVDWWSLGVTVYELLYGSLPFYSASISTTYEMIVSHQNFLSFPNSSSMIPTCNISFDAKDFIKSLLTDPHKRLGCDSTGVIQIQTHPWFKGIDWSIIRTVKPLYKPANTPLEIEPEEISMGIPASAVPGKAAAAFNFSAFFASSPGLSVLRSMKKPNQNPKRIEEEEEEEE
ncbi:kinase-like domain-containing protein, partial [Melampsora americana]